MKDTIRKQFVLNCEGYDENLIVEYVDYGSHDEQVIYILHVIPSFYARQRPYRNYLRRMFKMIWCAITGQEYSFFDIVIYRTDGQLEAFKKWVAEL